MASKSIQRSLAELKKRGYTAHSVERFNTFVKIRQDFGGFADILAYKAGEPGVLAIQACVGQGDVAKHVNKLAPLPNVKTWLQSNNRLEIWSWAKRGDRGKRKLWTMVCTPFQLGKAEFTATENGVIKANLDLEAVGTKPDLAGRELGAPIQDEAELLPF